MQSIRNGTRFMSGVPSLSAGRTNGDALVPHKASIMVVHCVWPEDPLFRRCTLWLMSPVRRHDIPRRRTIPFLLRTSSIHGAGVVSRYLDLGPLSADGSARWRMKRSAVRPAVRRNSRCWKKRCPLLQAPGVDGGSPEAVVEKMSAKGPFFARLGRCVSIPDLVSATSHGYLRSTFLSSDLSETP